MAIFNSLISDIEDLVAEQVHLVKMKRTAGYHEKADKVKASKA